MKKVIKQLCTTLFLGLTLISYGQNQKTPSGKGYKFNFGNSCSPFPLFKTGNLTLENNNSDISFFAFASSSWAMLNILDNNCNSTTIDLSDINNRKIEVRLKSDIDLINLYILPEGDDNLFNANRASSISLKANIWKTVTIEFPNNVNAQNEIIDMTQLNKIYISQQNHIAQGFSQFNLTIDYIFIGDGIPSKPTSTGIPDQNLVESFNSYSLDLKKYFDDVETSDENLIYSVSGTSDINVSITNGIATFSSNTDWSGSETLTFQAEDESGLLVTDTVLFTVIQADPPTITNPITNQYLDVNFSSYTIDLKNVFNDTETSDNDLIYTVSGNTNIDVSITNGIATITSTTDWVGTENITFTAEDQDGLTTTNTGNFYIEKTLYAWEFNNSITHCYPQKFNYGLGNDNTIGYTDTSDFNGTLKIKTNGKQTGFVGYDLDIYDQNNCNKSYNHINLSDVKNRKILIRIKSSVDVPQFFLLPVAQSDIGKAAADLGGDVRSLEAGKWTTLLLDIKNFNYYRVSFDNTPGKIDSSKVEILSLFIRNATNDNFPTQKTESVIGNIEIDYIRIGDISLNAPIVSSPIDDQLKEVNFNNYTIDLNNVFEDTETSDVNLVYSVSGNTNVGISITNGIATVSSTIGWAGTETILFTAEDEDGLTVSDEVIFNVVTSLATSPYQGTAQIIPGKVEAENFDVGHNGYAYNEINGQWDPKPVDNPYRTGHEVDIEELGTGIYNVGYFNVGEWLQYTVDIEQPGTYDFTFNLARPSTAGTTKIKVLLDDNALIAPVTIIETTDWQTYSEQTITGIQLPSGEHRLKIVMEEGGANFDYVNITKNSILNVSNTNNNNSTMSIYPNPTTGNITVNTGNTESGTITVRSMLGKTISTTEFSNSNKVEIELPELKNIYMLEVRIENGESTFLKVIKQ